jgi:hypothetical protein
MDQRTTEQTVDLPPMEAGEVDANGRRPTSDTVRRNDGRVADEHRSRGSAGRGEPANRNRQSAAVEHGDLERDRVTRRHELTCHRALDDDSRGAERGASGAFANGSERRGEIACRPWTCRDEFDIRAFETITKVARRLHRICERRRQRVSVTTRGERLYVAQRRAKGIEEDLNAVGNASAKAGPRRINVLE